MYCEVSLGRTPVNSDNAICMVKWDLVEPQLTVITPVNSDDGPLKITFVGDMVTIKK